jgi:hypothetical protein
MPENKINTIEDKNDTKTNTHLWKRTKARA